ncbi:MAG: universal stress protein [Bdellovibrionales bacterium]
METFKKVVWAVDALESPEHHTYAMHLLGALVRPTNAKVYPVYILSSPYAQIESMPPTDFEQAFQALAEKRLLELVNQSDLTGIAQGKVLVNRSGSIRKDVQCLVEHAKKAGADAIVVATHARKGLSRFFLGSFAETLAMYSPIPIITINPESKVRERISNILFPTTFHSRLRPGFERAVQLAKALDARLTLYYKEPVVPTSNMTAEIYNYIAQENAARAKRAEEWQAWAVHMGVLTDVEFDKRPGYLISAIADLAKEKNFDLIAIASEADPALTVLMGSVARQVIRGAECPVWVINLGDSAKDR